MTLDDGVAVDPRSHLLYDGIDVVELAEQVPTPFYLYSGRAHPRERGGDQ